MERSQQACFLKGDRKMRSNLDVRAEMLRRDIKQWQLAREIGVDEAALCRLLRHELPPERKDRLMATIMRLGQAAGEGETGGQL